MQPKCNFGLGYVTRGHFLNVNVQNVKVPNCRFLKDGLAAVFLGKYVTCEPQVSSNHTIFTILMPKVFSWLRGMGL